MPSSKEINIKDPLTKLVIKHRAERSLLFFTKYIFNQVQGDKYITTPFIEEMASKLQEVAEGKCTRLIINIPPRFGKTELAVVNFVAWVLSNNATAKFIHLSYSQSLALDNASKVKDIISHEAYKDLWELEYKDDSKAKEKWYTKQGGGMYSTSAGGQVTGFGAGDIKGNPFSGAIIIDDPLKAGDEHGAEREKVNERFFGTILNRLNNEKVPIIIIMQRLHEDDLSGHLLEKQTEKWEHIKIPALDENEESIWGERFSTKSLLELRGENPRVFAGQFMQEPSPAEGNIIDINWFQYYDTIPEGTIYQSWDTANKDGDANDYTACTTWLVKGTQLYVLDVFKKKMQFPELVSSLKSHYNKWKPRQVIIEDKASGQQLLQVLRKETSLPIVAYNPKTMSKSERMQTASIDVEVGRVYLKKKAHWLDELLEELKVFPNGKYKDVGDSFSMFINWHKSQRKQIFIG